MSKTHIALASLQLAIHRHFIIKSEMTPKLLMIEELHNCCLITTYLFIYETYEKHNFAVITHAVRLLILSLNELTALLEIVHSKF